MAFAIYRTEKLKSFGEIGGSISHTYRSRFTPNADENRVHLNEHSLKTHRECFEAIKNRIPEKHRSDAVLCIEHLITASPEWIGWGTKKEQEFFEKSLDFVKNKYGEKNVIASSIHRDETTPHLIVYVVPIDSETGRLNSKKWLGGKARLSQTQTEFANEVKHLGLERGVEKSLAKHRTIKEYYAEVNKTIEPVKIEKKLPNFNYEDSKIHAFDSKKIKDEKINNYIKPILNQQFKEIESEFRQVEKTLSTQLSAKTIEVEEKNKENQLAIRKIENLKNEISEIRKEYSTVIEFKGRFPDQFEKLEIGLKDKINEEKQRLEFEEYQRVHRQQQENLRQMQEQQNRKNIWISKIENEAGQGLERFLKAFNEKINSSSSELESNAFKSVIAKIESYRELASDPKKVFENGKNSENTSPYYNILYNLAYVKSKSELENFFIESLQFLNESKKKDYDDTLAFNFYDSLEKSVPPILALEKLLAYKMIDHADETTETTKGYSSFKEHLGEALIAKSMKSYNFEYDKLESDKRASEYSKELQAAINRQNNEVDKNQKNENKNRGSDFEY